MNQTAEICMEAVKRDGLALRYVIKQSPDIIKAAIAQNPEAEDLVRVENK